MRDTEELCDYDVRTAVARHLARTYREDMSDGPTAAIIINQDGTWHSPATGHSGEWPYGGASQDDGLPEVSLWGTRTERSS